MEENRLSENIENFLSRVTELRARLILACTLDNLIERFNLIKSDNKEARKKLEEELSQLNEKKFKKTKKVVNLGSLDELSSQHKALHDYIVKETKQALKERERTKWFFRDFIDNGNKITNKTLLRKELELLRKMKRPDLMQEFVEVEKEHWKKVDESMYYAKDTTENKEKLVQMVEEEVAELCWEDILELRKKLKEARENGNPPRLDKFFQHLVEVACHWTGDPLYSVEDNTYKMKLGFLIGGSGAQGCMTPQSDIEYMVVYQDYIREKERDEKRRQSREACEKLVFCIDVLMILMGETKPKEVGDSGFHIDCNLRPFPTGAEDTDLSGTPVELLTKLLSYGQQNLLTSCFNSIPLKVKPGNDAFAQEFHDLLKQAVKLPVTPIEVPEKTLYHGALMHSVLHKTLGNSDDGRRRWKNHKLGESFRKGEQCCLSGADAIYHEAHAPVPSDVIDLLAAPEWSQKKKKPVEFREEFCKLLFGECCSKVSLKSAAFVDDDMLKALLSCSKTLEELDVSGCENISECTSVPENLKVLTLKECRNLVGVNFCKQSKEDTGELDLDIRGCTKIKVLEVGKMKNITHNFDLCLPKTRLSALDVLIEVGKDDVFEIPPYVRSVHLKVTFSKVKLPDLGKKKYSQLKMIELEELVACFGSVTEDQFLVSYKKYNHLQVRATGNWPKAKLPANTEFVSQSIVFSDSSMVHNIIFVIVVVFVVIILLKITVSMLNLFTIR